MRTLSERSTACCLLLLAALWLCGRRGDRSADPGQEPAPHTPFELPFEVTDAVFDAQRRGMLDASSLANRRVYFVDLATGLVDREFGFDWMPERLTLSPDGSRLFVALLYPSPRPVFVRRARGLHRELRPRTAGEGSGVLDSEDPFDLAATMHGQIVVNWLGEWGHLRSFDAATGALLEPVSSVYEGVNIALHPSGSAVYATNNLCQASLERFDLNNNERALTRPGFVGFPLRDLLRHRGPLRQPARRRPGELGGDVVTAAGGGAERRSPLPSCSRATSKPSPSIRSGTRSSRETVRASGHHNLTSFEPIGTAAIGGEIAFLGVEGLRVLALLREPNETRLVEIRNPGAAGRQRHTSPRLRRDRPAYRPATRRSRTSRSTLPTARTSRAPCGFAGTWATTAWWTPSTDDPTLVRRFSTAGSREIRLRVKDTLGNIDERVVSVDVAFEADPVEAGRSHRSFVLPFVASHAVFDPVRPYVYVSSKDRVSLFFVNIATGLIERTFHFRRDAGADGAHARRRAA